MRLLLKSGVGTCPPCSRRPRRRRAIHPINTYRPRRLSLAAAHIAVRPRTKPRAIARRAEISGHFGVTGCGNEGAAPSAPARLTALCRSSRSAVCVPLVAFSL